MFKMSVDRGNLLSTIDGDYMEKELLRARKIIKYII